MAKIMTTRAAAEEVELSLDNWATRSEQKREIRTLPFGGVHKAGRRGVGQLFLSGSTSCAR